MPKRLREVTLTLNQRENSAESNTPSKDVLENGQAQDSNPVNGSKHKDRPKKKPKVPTASNGTPVNGYNPPTMDASGLFTVDTNPSPVKNEEIQEIRPSKRRRSEGDQYNGHVPALGMSVEEPRMKKLKKSDKMPKEQSETSDRRESFEQKVEKRFAEKEERRKKRSERKRKRESNGSAENQVSNPDLANHLVPPMNPRKRRRTKIKEQLQEAIKKNPDITFDDVRKLNRRKIQKRTAQMGITDIAEAHEAQMEWERQHPPKKPKKKA